MTSAVDMSSQDVSPVLIVGGVMPARLRTRGSADSCGSAQGALRFGYVSVPTWSTRGRCEERMSPSDRGHARLAGRAQVDVIRAVAWQVCARGGQAASSETHADCLAGDPERRGPQAAGWPDRAAVPDQRADPVRRAAPAPLGPSLDHLLRLLHQRPADRELPRHRHRYLAGPAISDAARSDVRAGGATDCRAGVADPIRRRGAPE